MKTRKYFLLLAGLWVGGIGIVLACSVPVFRYALERWRSDNYVVVIFHHGALVDSNRKLITALAPDPLVSPQVANIELKTVDLDNNPEKDVLQFWEKTQATTKAEANGKPWMMVFYPKTTGNPNPVWSGPLTKANADLIIDSPKRRELARRLLKGDSTVWLLLESGNQAKDEAAFKILAAKAAELEKKLKLPDIKQEDIAAGLLNIEESQLKLKFSTLRLTRKEAAEDVFIKMLLASEADLKDLKEPMVFPVYGRGRFMPALVGKGINDANLTEVAQFLTGPCSCQIKRENPGTDLLAAVNWESLIQPQINVDRELPPLTGIAIIDPDAKPATNPKVAGKPGSDSGNESAAAPSSENSKGTGSTSSLSLATTDTASRSYTRYLIFAGLAGLGLIGFCGFLILRPRTDD